MELLQDTHGLTKHFCRVLAFSPIIRHHEGGCSGIHAMHSSCQWHLLHQCILCSNIVQNLCALRLFLGLSPFQRAPLLPQNRWVASRQGPHALRRCSALDNTPQSVPPTVQRSPTLQGNKSEMSLSIPGHVRKAILAHHLLFCS